MPIQTESNVNKRLLQQGTRWSKFRKRAIVIEATMTLKAIVIQTPEGRLHAPAGWWIIRGIRGELYPCHPEIFADTYEPLAEVKGLPAHGTAGQAGDL